MQIIPTEVPHVEWIELRGNGVMHECVIMKEDDIGNKHFIELGSLDQIDKQRLTRVLRDRNAPTMELWDLMSNMTLNNGVNTLDYFHQLVKVLTPDGQIISPRASVKGAPTRIDTNSDEFKVAKEAAVKAAERAEDASKR